MLIREYDPVTDAQAVRACFLELQEFERRIEPELLPGSAIADDYLAWMFDQCRQYSGKVFVAEVDGKVVGYVAVQGRVEATEPDEPFAHAMISDLVVLASHRGTGLGHALLNHAEAFAREMGVPVLEIEVLPHNDVARQLYLKSGFNERWVTLHKKLE